MTKPVWTWDDVPGLDPDVRATAERRAVATGRMSRKRAPPAASFTERADERGTVTLAETGRE